MTSAVLRGREHTHIGAVDVVAEGLIAIANSRGGAPKNYLYTDPNEDVAGFFRGPGGALLAVADGHSGFEASEVVVEHLLTHPAPQWTDASADFHTGWSRHALAALCDANLDILRERTQGLNLESETTLVATLIRPETRDLLYACVGDSHLFVAGRGGVHELGARPGRPTPFLGARKESPDTLHTRCQLGRHDLTDALAVVCVTDGLSERGIGVEDPASAIGEAVAAAAEQPAEVRAMHLARDVCERACEAHRSHSAGDNVAAAVAWVGL
ncbi:MAG: protein phosphatase 2C family protein [bacterium]|nr:protein phosphatase 2C family protein [bacterium]MCP5070403.1 protein phosphatase 2C family protein [bacterium]